MASPPGTRIRVLIADDHAMVRRGMRDFLELHDDLEVVGEAGDGAEAVALASSLLPDVVVMDLLMPVMDGIEAITAIRASGAPTEVVALTSFMEEARVVAAMEAGAAGFLLKDAGADELAAAIRSAALGEVYLDRSVAAVVTRRMRAGGGPGDAAGTWPGSAGDPFAGLTARELDVLGGVARGLANRAIAEELGITERTARTHVSNILAKLRLESRTQAALLAVRHDLGRRR